MSTLDCRPRPPTIHRVLGSLRQFQQRLLAWYRAHRRDLPWRPPPGSRQQVDPWHVLVSEAMLQQTQVATVIPYFHRFIEHFPTPRHLADADLQAVLRLWQGLGYYSRARNLHRAASVIVARFAGQVPADVEQLLELPGVGRYTAGAVASIAHDQPAPIVDGNVMRVLCRLDGITADPRTDRAALNDLWQRAADILPARHCGDFNSALMELGATVCLPRSPACLVCPVADHCAARAAGIQDRIPPPRRAAPTPRVHRLSFLVRHGDRYLIEQRPATGRWAGMWQFPTHPTRSSRPARTIPDARASGLLGLPVSAATYVSSLDHALTHRRYTFHLYTCTARTIPDANAANPRPRQWVTLAELDHYPRPRPHLRMLDLHRQSDRADTPD